LTVKKHGGAECEGETEEEADCNSAQCPIDCVYGEWAQWSQCDKSCAGGFMSRSRDKKVADQFGGKACEGDPIEKLPCDLPNCPVDCVFSAWSDWGECTSSCGKGIRYKTRKREEGRYGGLACVGGLISSEDCVMNATGCFTTTSTTTVTISSTTELPVSNLTDVIDAWLAGQPTSWDVPVSGAKKTSPAEDKDSSGKDKDSSGKDKDKGANEFLDMEVDNAESSRDEYKSYTTDESKAQADCDKEAACLGYSKQTDGKYSLLFAGSRSWKSSEKMKVFKKLSKDKDSSGKDKDSSGKDKDSKKPKQNPLVTALTVEADKIKAGMPVEDALKAGIAAGKKAAGEGGAEPCDTEELAKQISRYEDAKVEKMHPQPQPVQSWTHQGKTVSSTVSGNLVLYAKDPQSVYQSGTARLSLERTLATLADVDIGAVEITLKVPSEKEMAEVNQATQGNAVVEYTIYVYKGEPNSPESVSKALAKNSADAVTAALQKELPGFETNAISMSLRVTRNEK